MGVFHFKVWKILIWKKKRVEKSQLIRMTRKIMPKSSFFFRCFSVRNKFFKIRNASKIRISFFLKIINFDNVNFELKIMKNPVL